MKRTWLFLLSLALVAGFSVSAFAVDVKFSGSYFVAGMYQDKTNFLKGGYYQDPATLTPLYSDGPSTAFYYQRLRLKTEFTISKGLKFISRMDVLERSWGATRSASGTTADSQSAGTRAENENVAIDWAYLEYESPIGYFNAGISEDNVWGTVFSDSSVPAGLFTYAVQKNGFTAFIQVVKTIDKSKSAVNTSSAAADYDTDKYQIGALYEWKTGQAGVLAVYYRSAATRPDDGALGKIFSLQPYAIVNIGPVKIQAEIDYAWGDIKNDNPGYPENRVDNLAGWIDATADLKMFYVGGTFAYVAGMDWNNAGVIRGGFLTGGMDWSPTLILFNTERDYWAGPITGNGVTSTQMNFISGQFGLNDTGMYNAWFFQARAGVRPTDKFDIMASVSYALADSKTHPYMGYGFPEMVSNVYGTEIDVTATYKITNNLSYMLGAGYLFTGAYFKGWDDTAEVRDNYLLLNKLTLTF